MKRYCFDTSGVSNPLEQMPEDIHETMWTDFKTLISSDILAVTTEIFDEMVSIPGSLGSWITQNKNNLVLEVGEHTWDWNSYIQHSTRMQNQYREFISEYTGGSKKTICLNDLSIVALAKTLALPVVSMESRMPDGAQRKRRIPNICDSEGIQHLSFNDFLRQESMRF